MKILSRPFPITYILERHQHKISQKEWVNPELKAMEVLLQTFSHNILSELKKRHVLEQEILLPLSSPPPAPPPNCPEVEPYQFKTKEYGKETMFTSSLKGP